MCWRVHLCLIAVVFFFVKQKTAYEMRISDWSSDVCSSDLSQRQALHGGGGKSVRRQCLCRCGRTERTAAAAKLDRGRGDSQGRDVALHHAGKAEPEMGEGSGNPALFAFYCTHRPVTGVEFQQQERSEEHTSELQSLMRISYAVFCSKNKKNNINI